MCMAIAMIVSTNILGTSSRLSTFHHSHSDSCLVVPYVSSGTFCPLFPHKHLWHTADAVNLKRVHCYNLLQCPSNPLDGER